LYSNKADRTMHRPFSLIIAMMMGWAAASSSATSDDSQTTGTTPLVSKLADQQFRRALSFYLGTAGKIDLQLAEEHFVMAMDAGDPRATFWLARLVLMERIESNVLINHYETHPKSLIELILPELEKLAISGDSAAQYCLLAAPLIADLSPLVTGSELLDQLRLIAEKGELSAMQNLANAYASRLTYAKTDETHEMHFRTAKMWATRAAEEGDAWSMYTLGLLFHDHSTTESDKQHGLYWLRKSAARDHCDAQEKLGLILLDRGEGLDSAAREGFDWIHRAAAQGSRSAKMTRADCLATAHGTPQDMPAAFAQWLKVANLGDPRAMRYAGLCYLFGEGVDEDTQQARYWLQQAANAGDENAAFFLDDLTTILGRN
jgi:TPR repeat protein